MADTAEKTEDQIAREKAQVAAFKNAQAVMSATLSRCDRLEGALRRARDNLASLKHYIGTSAYASTPSGYDRQTVHALIDAMVAEATKNIGAV